MVTLRTQYRMAGDIQAVANELVYNGVLRCGCPAVEAAALTVHPSTMQHPPWLQQVPAAPPPCCFAVYPIIVGQIRLPCTGLCICT